MNDVRQDRSKWQAVIYAYPNKMFDASNGQGRITQNRSFVLHDLYDIHLCYKLKVNLQNNIVRFIDIDSF